MKIYTNVSIPRGLSPKMECDCQDEYNSGYTAGYQKGEKDQKSKLSFIVVTENGDYTNEDGYSAITVNVPQTGSGASYESGYTDGYEDGYDSGSTDGYNEGYPSGYTNGYQSGSTDGWNKGYPSGYTDGYGSGRTDGYQDGWQPGYNSGYTDGVEAGGGDYASGYTDGFEHGYDSGSTDGEAAQKAKLTSTAFTQNGTYTRADGWSSVNVNVSGYTKQDLDNAFNSGWTNGYNSGYTDGYNDASGQTQEATALTLNVASAITGSGHANVTVEPVNARVNLSYTSSDPTIATVSSNGDINVLSSGTVTITVTDSISQLTDSETIAVTPASGINVPLTVEVISAGTILWVADTGATPLTIEYQLNDGNWTSITSTVGGTSIPVVAGDTVRFRGNNSQYSTSTSEKSNRMLMETGKYALKGNIMSLIDSTGYTTATTFGWDAFVSFFKQNVGLVDASGLILPAEPTLACYWSMFNGCTNLTSAPVTLPETTAQMCYLNMFRDCTSLVTAPKLPATSLTESCYQNMFTNCTSLETAPDLPASVLVRSCYNDMFIGCTNLNYIKCMAVSGINTDSSTNWWVYDVQTNSGTFIKDPNSNWPAGVNGIPDNWTVQDA